MSDLMKRLEEQGTYTDDAAAVCREAYVEIERLRDALWVIANKTVMRTPHTYEDDLGDRLESIQAVTKEALGDD